MGIKVLAFFVTEKCNLSCEYCDIPHIKSPKHYDIPVFLQYIPIINKFPLDSITITGGEPGLLPEVHLDMLFRNIEHPINVNTNGEFIRRGYYEKYKDKIQLLDYHVTDDKFEKLKDDKVRFIIVNHKLNQDFVELTLMNNPDIKFTLYEYDDKLNEEKFRTGYENPYKDCYFPIKEIDWVNKKLVDCCSSPISAPKDDLTPKNLDMFLLTNYARPWHACKTCTWQAKRYEKN